MAEKITLPAQLARDLRESDIGDTLDGWAVVAHQRGEDSRWAAAYHLVIQDEGHQHYAAPYRTALGDSAVPDRWESATEVTFEPVTPVAQAVITYMPPNDAKPDTVAINGRLFEVQEWDLRNPGSDGEPWDWTLYAVPASA